MSENNQSMSRIAMFTDAVTSVDVTDQVHVLPGLPAGLGPLISDIHSGDAPSTDPQITVGVVETGSSALFRLAAPQHVTSKEYPSQVMPVTASVHLGSEDLAAALGSRDLPAVLEVLAVDLVAVPVVVSGDGVVSTRVFRSAEDSAYLDLCVFSSARSLDGFLGQDGERCFTFIQGTAVVSYVAEQCDRVKDVVFDPAGPVSMRISAANLTSFLDEDAPVEETIPQDPPTGEVTGFDLPLNAQWGRIHLTDPVTRERDIRALVADQTRVLGDQGASVRREVQDWLSKAASQASLAGGMTMAFLLERTNEAAAAVTVTSYLLSLGPAPEDSTHLDDITKQVLDTSSSDDIVMRIDAGQTVIIRRTRIGHGDPQVGGSDVQLLHLAYWLVAPDNEHAVHVVFSSPHLPAQEAITKLADNMVLEGRWVFRDTTDLVRSAS
ncbi:MAG: hypothetical protein FWF43_00870 [Propionibacteriaceae bacterium]|nr:hypothetical protein [Propionibacteriaceae bacterium]